jgi:Flp pilus assembly protein TadG
MELNKNPQRFERGQSLVEFAFSIVMLFILIAGIVDGGRALFTYMALREGAQEGALYGSYEPSDTDGIRTRVFNSSQALEDLSSQVQVDISWSGPACNGHGIEVRVKMDNFQLTMPFLGALVGSQTIPISASITDTILTPPCTSS